MEERRSWHIPTDAGGKVLVNSDLNDAAQVQAGFKLKESPTYFEGAVGLHDPDPEENKRIEKEVRNIMSQFGKGIITGGEQTFGALGRSIVEAAGQTGIAASAVTELLANPVTRAVKGDELNIEENLKKDFKGIGDSILKNNAQLQGWLFSLSKNNEYMMEQLGLVRDEKDGFFHDLGAIIPQLGMSVILKNPALVGSAFGMISKRQNTEEIQDREGVDSNTAQTVGNFAGVTSGVINGVGIHYFFKALKFRGIDKVVSARVAPAVRAILGAGAEGIEEAVDTGSEELIMNTLGGRGNTLWQSIKNTGYAALLGVFGGAFFSVPGAYYYNRRINETHEALKEVKPDATEEEARTIVDAAIDGVVSKEAQDIIASIAKDQNSIVSYRNGKVEDTIEADKKVLESYQKVQQDLEAERGTESEEQQFSDEDFYNAENQSIVEDFTTDDETLTEPRAEYKAIKEDAEFAGAESGQYADAAIQWQEKGTESPYFKKWFGDSKVVDKNGKPLIVYHGTTNMLSISKHGFKSGETWLTDSKVVADSYQAWQKGNSPGTLPLYIKIEKPYYIDMEGRKKTDPSVNIGYKISSALYEAQKKGFDGVIIKNIRDHFDGSINIKPHTVFILFNPKQIKSVNNQGTFDANNSNIFRERVKEYEPRIFQPSAQNQQKYRQSLEKALADTKHNRRIELGDTPAVLQMLGLQNLPVISDKEVILKATGLKEYKNPHNVKEADVLRLIDLIHDPVAVLETRPGNFVMVLDTKDKSGRMVTAALNPGKNSYHFVPTVFGRDGFEGWFNDHLNKGNVKYINGNSPEISDLAKPKPLDGPQGYDVNIATKEDIVKFVMQKEKNDIKFKEAGNVYGEQLDLFENNKKASVSLSGKKNYTKDADYEVIKQNMKLSVYEMPNYTLLGESITGPAVINNPDEVAYLFKQLESAATENAFAVMVNETGEYDILYLSSGANNKAVVDTNALFAAIQEKNPQKIYLVHNHPGGTLEASLEDKNFIQYTKRNLTAMGSSATVDGIIIDLDSGQYVLFDVQREVVRRRIDIDAATTQKVYAFNKAEYFTNMSDEPSVNSPEAAAVMLSKLKRGLGNKLFALYLTNSNKVMKCIAIPQQDVQQISKAIVNNYYGYSGRVILAANYALDEKTNRLISNTLMDIADISVLDTVVFKENEDVMNNYVSFMRSRSLFDKHIENVFAEDEAQYRALSAESYKNILKSKDEKTILNFMTKRFADVLFAAEKKSWDAALKDGITEFKKEYGIKGSKLNYKQVEQIRNDYIQFLQNENLSSAKDAIFIRMSDYISNMFSYGINNGVEMSRTAENISKAISESRKRKEFSETDRSEILEALKADQPIIAREKVSGAIRLLQAAKRKTPPKPKRTLRNKLITFLNKNKKRISDFKKVKKDVGAYDFADFDIINDLGWVLEYGQMETAAENVETLTQEEITDQIRSLIERAMSGEDIYAPEDRAKVERINEIEEGKEAARSLFESAELSEKALLDRLYLLYNDSAAQYDVKTISDIAEALNMIANKDISNITKEDREQIIKTLSKVRAAEKKAILEAKTKQDLIDTINGIRDNALKQIVSEQESGEDSSMVNTPNRRSIGEFIVKASEAVLNGVEQNKTGAFKKELRSLINSQRHLSAYHKQLLMVRLEKIQDAKDFIKEINKLADDIYRYSSEGYNKYISEKIDNIADLAWKIKNGSLWKGKFNANDNEFFRALQEVSRMSPAEAEAFIAQMEQNFNKDDIDNANITEQEKVLIQYATIKAGHLSAVQNNTNLENLFKKMVQLRKAAAEGKTAADILGDEKFNQEVEGLLEKLDKKNISAVGKFFVDWFGSNLETLNNYLFGKESTKKVKTLEASLRKAKIKSYSRRMDLINRLAKIYGVKTAGEFAEIWDKNSREEFLFTKYVDGKPVTEKLNRNNLIYIYSQLLNENQMARYMRQYGDTQVMKMISLLTEADKKVALELIEVIAERYEALNEAYIDIRGFGIPQVNNYFPSTGINTTREVDLLSDFKALANVANQQFANERAGVKVEMAAADPLNVAFKNINTTENVIHAGKQILDLNKIIKDKRIRNGLSDYKKFGDRGKQLHDALRKAIDYVVMDINGGMDISKNEGVIKSYERTLNNLIVAAIGLKPIIAIKQMASFINYADSMPTADFVKYSAEFWAHPIESFKFVFSDEYYKMRFKDATMNELLNASSTTFDKKNSKLKDFITFSTRGGDAVACVVGSYAYIRYAMENGASREAAFDKAIDLTESAQQSAATITQANFQNAAKHKGVRFITAFTNTNNQYFRKIINATIDYKNGVIDAQQFIKTLSIYVVIDSLVFSFLTVLPMLLFGDKDKKYEAARDLLVSPLDMFSGALPVIGEVAMYLISAGIDMIAQGKVKTRTPDPLSLIANIYDELGNVSKILNGKGEAEHYIGAMSLITKLASALDLRVLYNQASGIKDIVEGKPIKGLSRVIRGNKGTAFDKKKKRRQA